MPKCGCASGCACLVQGSSPIRVTGNGAPGSPYVIALERDGLADCDAIVACVGDNLGPGLVRNPVTNRINVRLSTDPGNSLVFGSDNGLYTPEGGDPEVGCERTIEALPAFAFGGTTGGAGLLHAYGSKNALQYAVRHALDIVSVDVNSSLDGIPLMIQYNADNNLTDRTNAFSNYLPSQIRASEWAQLLVAHGTPRQPQRNTVTTGWPKEGGWYGFLEPEEQQWTLPEWIAALGRRAVAIVGCNTTALPLIDEVNAVIRTVTRTCTQKSVMIRVADLSVLPAILDQALTPIVSVTPATAATLTPAAVAATGCRWVQLNDQMTDAQITAYKTAGLNVLVQTNSRQLQTARMRALGVRGILAFDPVYARGNPAEYQRLLDNWSSRMKQPGQLTIRTDRYDVMSANGYTSAADHGWYLESGSSEGRYRAGMLVGWACPIPADFTSYTVNFKVRPAAGGSGGGSTVGLVFGAADDRNPTYTATADIPGPMYVAYHQYQGTTMGLWYGEPGNETVLASRATASSPPNTELTYRVQVTPTSISFGRRTGTNTWDTVTSNDTRIRGRYLHVMKEEKGGNFTAAYTGFSVVKD